jgi:hypothetical protein
MTRETVVCDGKIIFPEELYGHTRLMTLGLSFLGEWPARA